MIVCDIVKQLESQVSKLTPKSRETIPKTPERPKGKILQTTPTINGKISSPSLNNIPRIDLPSQRVTSSIATSLVNKTVQLVVPSINRKKTFSAETLSFFDKYIQYHNYTPKEKTRVQKDSKKSTRSKKDNFKYSSYSSLTRENRSIRIYPINPTHVDNYFRYTVRVKEIRFSTEELFEKRRGWYPYLSFYLDPSYLSGFFSTNGIYILYTKASFVEDTSTRIVNYELHDLIATTEAVYQEKTKTIFTQRNLSSLSASNARWRLKYWKYLYFDKVSNRWPSEITIYDFYTSNILETHIYPRQYSVFVRQEEAPVVKRFNLPKYAAFLDNSYAYSRAIENITILREHRYFWREKEPPYADDSYWVVYTETPYGNGYVVGQVDIIDERITGLDVRIHYIDGTYEDISINLMYFVRQYARRVYGETDRNITILPLDRSMYIPNVVFLNENWVMGVCISPQIRYYQYNSTTYFSSENFEVWLNEPYNKYLFTYAKYVARKEDFQDIEELILELAEFWEENDLYDLDSYVRLYFDFRENRQGSNIEIEIETWLDFRWIDEEEIEDILEDFEIWRENQYSFESRYPIFEKKPTKKQKKEEEKDKTETPEQEEKGTKERKPDDYSEILKRQHQNRQRIPKNINKRHVPLIYPQIIPQLPMAAPIPLPPIGGWQQVPGQLLTPPPRSTPASPVVRIIRPTRPTANVIPFPGTEQQTQTPPRGGSSSRPPSPPDFPCEKFGQCARQQLPPILRQSYHDDLRPALDAWFNARLQDIRNALQRVENNTVETLNRIGDPNQGVGGQRTLFGSIRYVVGNVIWNNAVTYLGLLVDLHNAMMLSRNIAESLGQLIENVIDILPIKGLDGQSINLAEALGQRITDFIKRIVGEDNWRQITIAWKKLSAIYTAAVNIYQMALDSLAGIAEALQLIGNRVALIGNALKRGGVVLENAYDWMEENIAVKTGKFAIVNKLNAGLMELEEAIDDLVSATEEIKEVQESMEDIQEEWNTIKQELELEKNRVNTRESEGKQNAQLQTSIDRKDFAPQED